MKTPIPFFDSIENITSNQNYKNHLETKFHIDYSYSLNFLKSYQGSIGTFNSYRREVERLLQWCFYVQNKNLKDLTREDIELFIKFCLNPPKSWIGTMKVPRFINKDAKRVANPDWRPFLIMTSSKQKKTGNIKENFGLSQGAVQEIFAILSTFFNFLIVEECITVNPVALIRQKSKFIRKFQQSAPIRRLSLVQWRAVLDASEDLARQDPKRHERTRFILSMLYGMYLRISEVTASERWVPTMNNFYKDNEGSWWFTTIGKGNKQRQIAVSDAMLESLIRWRTHLNLTPLPNPADNSVLIPKIKGHGPMTDTSYIRKLVQDCFNLAQENLRLKNLTEEAQHLSFATVHWLRHTGISEDVKTRPREHVRDDAGHSSSATTDKYIDVLLKARFKSAKDKKIIPTETKESSEI